MKSKIFISILIIMVVIASLAQINFKSIAASSTTANIEVETKNAVQGDTVTIDINLKNSVDFIAGNFTLTYNSAKLEYNSYSVGTSLEDKGTVIVNAKTSGQIKIGYMSDANLDTETKVAGQLISLTFNVKAGAGTTEDLKLECSTLKKADGTNVTANITNAKLNIISGIKINNSNISIEVGKTATLTVTTLPTSVDISNEKITWKSANESVATVNSNGVVTAVGVGNTKITATMLGLSSESTVTVTSPLQSISLSETEVTLNKGESKTLEVRYNPENTTDSKEVEWSSSDTNVATVDANGKITAVGSGTATVTATVGNKTATCIVTVPGGLVSISLNTTSVTLPKTQIKQLTVIYNPADTVEDKTVTWTSSNESVAIVDANGLVTAKTEGTAIITATVGNKTAICQIMVSGNLGDVDKDENITAYDAYKALEASVDISAGIEVEEQTILISDVDRDQNVTAQDAYNILRYSIGLVEEF